MEEGLQGDLQHHQQQAPNIEAGLVQSISAARDRVRHGTQAVSSTQGKFIIEC